jgi:hypothetical protein
MDPHPTFTYDVNWKVPRADSLARSEKQGKRIKTVGVALLSSGDCTLVSPSSLDIWSWGEM